MKEMADGTIRVQVDIDPACRGDFLKLFPSIDMPVALAPLVAQFEQAKPVVAQNDADIEDKPGALRVLACQLCKNPKFQEFLEVESEDQAKQYILETCDIASRKELDTDVTASFIFEKMRREYRAFVEGRQ
jgi:hypothetical protein